MSKAEGLLVAEHHENPSRLLPRTQRLLRRTRILHCEFRSRLQFLQALSSIFRNCLMNRPGTTLAVTM